MQAGRPVRPSDAPETATAESAPLTDAARRYFPNLVEKIDGFRTLRPGASGVAPLLRVRLQEDDAVAKARQVDELPQEVASRRTEAAAQSQNPVFAPREGEPAAERRAQPGRPVHPSEAPETGSTGPEISKEAALRYSHNLAEKIDGLRTLRPDPSRVVPFPGVRLAPPPPEDDAAAEDRRIDAREEEMASRLTESAAQLQIALFAQLKAELAAQLRELSDIAGRFTPATEPEPAPQKIDIPADAPADVAGAAPGAAGIEAQAGGGVDAPSHAVPVPLPTARADAGVTPLPAPVPAAPVEPGPAIPVSDDAATFSDLESSVHGLVAAARRQNGAFNETLLRIRLGLKEETTRIDLAFALARDDGLAPVREDGVALLQEADIAPAGDDAVRIAPRPVSARAPLAAPLSPPPLAAQEPPVERPPPITAQARRPAAGEDAAMIALLDDIVGFVDAHEKGLAPENASPGYAELYPARAKETLSQEIPGQESLREESPGQETLGPISRRPKSDPWGSDRWEPTETTTTPDDDFDAILAAMAVRLVAPKHKPAGKKAPTKPRTKPRAEPQTETRAVRTRPRLRPGRAAGDAPSGKPRLRHTASAAMAADAAQDFLSLYGERRLLIADDIEADISGLVRDVYRGGRHTPPVPPAPLVLHAPSEPARPGPRPLADPVAPAPRETSVAAAAQATLTPSIASPPRPSGPTRDPVARKNSAAPPAKSWVDFLLRAALLGATAFGALMLGAHLIKFDRGGAPVATQASAVAPDPGAAAPAETGAAIDPRNKYIDTYASTDFTPPGASSVPAQPPMQSPAQPPASVPPPAPPPPPNAAGPAEIKSLIPLSGPLAKTRALATTGDPEAQYRLANLLMEGKDIQRDPRAAAQWYQKAADQGFIKAYARLGALYENGVGVEKDPAQAIAWYKAAAEAGHVQSMHNLGVLLTNSEGGREDLPAAARWFRQAAEYGVRDSQYNLAIFYAQGEGVEASNLQAYVWSAIAARQGDAEAEKMRKELAPRLSAQDMVKATVAIRKFNPKLPNNDINNG